MIYVLNEAGPVSSKPAGESEKAEWNLWQTSITATVVWCTICGNRIDGRHAKVKWMMTCRFVTHLSYMKCTGCHSSICQTETLHDGVETRTEFSCFTDRMDEVGYETGVTSRSRQR